MISRRQIISGSAGPIFTFSPNESVLGADDRSGPLFSISQGTLPWQPILYNATISCKVLVKIGPVVLAENSLIEIALRIHVVVWRISSNISGC